MEFPRPRLLPGVRQRLRRHVRRWLAVSGGVALMLAAALLPSAGAVHVAPSAVPFTVLVSATPSSGSVPLTVVLTATVSSGTPTAVSWSFGDGAQWSNFAGGGLTVSHRYVAVGSFNAIATVTESGGTESGSTIVNVESGSLVALIAATPANGTSPLTVTYHAVVSGGTGTYTSFSWAFGDGSFGSGPVVQYVYHSAGKFTATLTVLDSANESTVASYAISVNGPTPTSGSGGSALSAIGGPAALAATGLVGAGLTFGVFSYRRHRRGPSTASIVVEDDTGGSALPGAPSMPAALPAPLMADAAPSESAASETSAAEVVESIPAPSSPRALVAPILVTVGPPLTTGPRLDFPRTVTSPPGTPPPSPAGEEPRRWSKEIVAYLGGLPTLGPDDIATLDWTQKGMSERLKTGQNQVSNVLRRLVAAGVVVEDLQHVQGQPRRLKVYRLSMRGEALAREIRRRRDGRNPNYMRREW